MSSLDHALNNLILTASAVSDYYVISECLWEEKYPEIAKALSEDEIGDNSLFLGELLHKSVENYKKERFK
jgi:hypothetical protein